MIKTQVIVLGGVIALAGVNVHAQSIAAASTANPTANTWTTVAGNFIQNQFTFTLSKNVSLIANDNATAVAASAASVKGTSSYGGGSSGGGIVLCSSFPATATPVPFAAAASGTGCT